MTLLAAVASEQAACDHDAASRSQRAGLLPSSSNSRPTSRRHWDTLRQLHARHVVLKRWLAVPQTRGHMLSLLGRCQVLGASGKRQPQASARAMVAPLPAAAHHGHGQYGAYLSRLRAGTRAAIRIVGSEAHVAAQAGSIAVAAGLVARDATSNACTTTCANGTNAMGTSSGGAVTEVESQAAAEELEWYQQGNIELYTAERLKQRARLRRDPRVAESLEMWWQAALRGDLSEGSRALDGEVTGQGNGGIDHASSIGFGGYTAFLSRVYRVILRDFEAVEAGMAIEKDWVQDSRGAERLTRTRFLDSLFELADMWTAGICPYQYTAFLMSLFDKVSVANEKRGWARELSTRCCHGHCLLRLVVVTPQSLTYPFGPHSYR